MDRFISFSPFFLTMPKNLAVICLVSFGCLVFMISINACSANKVSKLQRPGGENPFATASVLTPLSEWLVSFPEGDNLTIGVSKVTRDWSDMYKTAREMATVQYARNLSSFNIDKYIIIQNLYGDIARDQVRSYIFQVSDAKELWRIHDRLELLRCYMLHNSYLIALFQLQDEPVANDSLYQERIIEPTFNVDSISPEVPDWYEKNEIIVTTDYLYSISSASSACLVDAWDKASKGARHSFANYFSITVGSVLDNAELSESERQKNVIALETLYNLRDIELSRSYISTAFRDNNLRYTVYIEMKMAL